MDGIFGIGPLELFFIAVIALIVLGPERLPHALREVAKTIRKVRELTSEFTSQFSDELQALDEINPRKILSDMVDPTKPLPGEPKSAASNGATSNGATVSTSAAAVSATDKSAQVKAKAFVSSQAATEQARATKAAKEAKAKEEAELKAEAALKAEAELKAEAGSMAEAGLDPGAEAEKDLEPEAMTGTEPVSESVSASGDAAVDDVSSSSATLEPSDGALPANSILPPELRATGAPEEISPLPVAEAVEVSPENPQPVTADESA